MRQRPARLLVMCAEGFTYLLRPLAQPEIPVCEADIEAGWQKLAARLDKLSKHRDHDECSCIDLPGPHGRLAAPAPAPWQAIK